MKNNFRTELFPEISPYTNGMLPLDNLHTMYWEQSGKETGLPVLFLHGGPGAGSSPAHRCFFDPAYYRIVIYDQRGAGRSTPLGETHNNTTPHLIDDIEVLRQYLGITEWLVFGGSWGSTLALAYSETYPARCLGLILRGIFLCRKSEIDWFLYGLKNFFPEAWHTFVSLLPSSERDNILAAYYRRLVHPEYVVHMPAALAWSVYEGSCSTLLASPETVAYFTNDVVAIGLARIEAHYFSHEIFLPKNSLLDNIKKIRSIPAVIIQGRYDAVCPIVSANDLHCVWPEAQYIVIADAGHSAWEPGIQTELIKATERFKNGKF